MCILSGCDYLASVPGIGLGKATKMMRKCGQNPERVCMQLILIFRFIINFVAGDSVSESGEISSAQGL
jgi:5'-3' exonuclease